MSLTSPVLFLPGTLCDERVWLPVWRQLHLTQRRYVPLQWAASLEEMLALTADRVLDNERVHLVGYSMGGYIAAHYALSHPQHVASLTLIGYDPDGLSKDELARRKQLVAALKKGQFNPAAKPFVQRFVHPRHQQSPEVAGVVTDMARDLGKNTLLAHTQSTTPRQNLTAKLKIAPFSINILGAKDDAVAPYGDLKRASRALDAAQTEFLDDTAHMMLLEQPDVVARLIQAWLDISGP
ncbi:alpha/beta fold hydrolase [Alteromonas halophila]|uniref:Hydrolase n=1 Tax=Alteromonas halophila TaxID=516698 RepID=A0A918JJC8_9ALTE|nr:alpha/beta hydrolase [Alteromonas halophila]GGW83968.1 hydrolase [Alteromonas halophila]